LFDGMSQGQPVEGDQGLDKTHTWGRTYWGGALYWMLADVQIRQQTGNKKGLQDAMRTIVSSGGAIVHEWPIEKVLQVGDQATGTKVLAYLYNRMKATAVQTDLDDLWAKLGIQISNGAVKFNDNAPLADIRKAITAGH
jgi:predicted metalloprotease with PDZ domain